jgi:hypothetical protein
MATFRIIEVDIKARGHNQKSRHAYYMKPRVICSAQVIAIVNVASKMIRAPT